MDDSVKLIRDAGGLTFLAHWFTSKEKITVDILGGFLQSGRLDGCETVCGLWSGGTLPKKEIQEDYLILKSLAEKYNKLESGGCDLHSEPDLEIFQKESWYSERTIGMVENIINKSNIDTTWSSFQKDHVYYS